MNLLRQRYSNQKSGRRRIIKFTATLLLIIAVLGLQVYLIFYFAARGVLPVEPPSGNQSAPSSAVLSAQTVAAYQVAPNLPKYLKISALGIAEARIIPLGLLKNNQIAVPDNINDAGWYRGSAKPGQSGAMFIYGHISSWTAKGVFYNLNKLRPRDIVTIASGDNRTYNYLVKQSKIYSAADVNMMAVLAPIVPGRAGLNLMTCAGPLIKGTSEFSERLVVFATLV